MPLVVKDRVRETSTTTGTGTFTLAGAVTGYQSFSAIGNGNTTYYTIYLQGGNEWEVGIGTYTASGTTLSRDTILASSNGGSAVNFSAGVKDVFVTYPAGRSVYYDTATNVTLNALTLSGGAANGVLYLNASKVATSGSALTFDGTQLSVAATVNNAGIFTSTATTTALVLDNTNANGWGSNLAIRTGGTAAGYFGTIGSLIGSTAQDLAVYATAGNGFRVYTDGNNERLRITSGGKVNIGGNFTSTNNTLQVTGTVAIGDTLAGPTDGLYVKGNVGIGTNATTSYPVAPNLVVASATTGGITVRSGSSSYGGLFFADGTTGDEQYRGFLQYNHNWAGLTDALVVGTAGIERVRIDSAGTVTLRQSSNAANTSVSFNTTVQNALTLDSSGNLGVGSGAVTPARRLDVQSATAIPMRVGTGDSNMAIEYVSTLGTRYNWLTGAQYNVNGGFEITPSTAVGNTTFTSPALVILGSSGNVGIGTTNPLSKLDVAGGSIRVNEDGVGTKIITIRSDFAGLGPAINVTVTQPLLFLTANTERARISSDGTFRVKGAGTAGSTDAVQFGGGAPAQSLILDSTGRLMVATATVSTTYNALTVAGTGITIADDGNAKLQIGRYSAGIPNSYIKLGPNSSSLRITNAADTADLLELTNTGNLFVGTSVNTNSSRLVVNGTISETVSSTQYLVASQADIGTAPNEIPLNQYLGNLAYQDAGSIAGQVGLSAGTAALPSLVSATDTDTGMWFPAANTLALSTGGTERARINSNGSFVIGYTGSNNARFNVTGGALPSDGGVSISSSLAAGRLATGNTNNTTGIVNVFNDNGVLELSAGTTSAAFAPAGIVISADGAATEGSTLRFFTYAAEKARITAAGGFETRPTANGHAVFNENSVDADFRVESDANTHMLFVDAGTNTVGIGTSITDMSSLGLIVASNTTTNQGSISVVRSDFKGTPSDVGPICWYRGGNTVERTYPVAGIYGRDEYNGGAYNGSLHLQSQLAAALYTRLSLQVLEAVFNDNSLDYDFRVESDTDTHCLFVDASSNFVGIGASAPAYKLNIKSTETSSTTTPVFTLGLNRQNSNTAGLLLGMDANTDAVIAPNNAALRLGNVFTGTFSEYARFTSNGSLGIGESNPESYGKVVIRKDTASGAGSSGASCLWFLNANTTANNASSIFFGDNATTAAGGINFINTDHTNEYGVITFDTRGSGGYGERVRITSGGYFKASNDGAYFGSTGAYHELRSTANDYVATIVNAHASDPYGIDIRFSSASPDNNNNYFLRCLDGTAVRCYIYSDGDLANHDGVYGTISDQKLKQDIVDAGSQWGDIKAIRFRKYRMKSDVAVNPDAPYLLGVVAQELEQVSPGLVDEHPDMETVEVTDEDGNVTQTQQPTGTTTKSVKSSILLMKAAVALQEAMARIEKLEAEVAALKGA